MQSLPIIIMGFGRSGTTWVSDIISKTLGGLILFEPFHPAVNQKAYEYLYTSGQSKIEQAIYHYSEELMAKRYQQRWLLRNHLPLDLDYTDTEFETQVWRECEIIGYKEIRLNLMLPNFLEKNNSKIIFTIRHPLAVLASIKKRTRFWLEFGFEQHYQKFIKETFDNPQYINSSIQQKRFWLNETKDEISKAALMWAVTHELLAQDLTSKNIYLLDYEKLYNDPFRETRYLLSFLNKESAKLHPSYIFTPSMTTHKTLHGSKDMSNYQKLGNAFFWETILTANELKTCCQILNSFNCPIVYSLPH